MITLSGKLLLGRLLTRSGDQAWDFAVPLVLLRIFPGHLQVAAFYYLIIRLSHVVLLPHLASSIDHINRKRAVLIGILLQLVGVLVGVFAIYKLSHREVLESYLNIDFVILVVGGIFSSLGASFMDISIANDLVPSSIESNKLPWFNSRLRQIDLATEVGAPIIAGLTLSIESNSLLGFYFIGLWNAISFFPEYGLLVSIFRERPDLERKPILAQESLRTPFLQKLTSGWRSFFRQPVAPAMLAYAFLWVSVLSPHGVLLTVYLKDGWQLPEWLIGTFRGLGAVFGLLATVLFPRIINKFGLEKGSGIFLGSQAIFVSLALVCFFQNGPIGQIGFLAFVLLSRIGLYGFSLGEMQIRQSGVPVSQRGEVNGFASALTGIATLGLYGMGTLLPSSDDFGLLIILSALMVGAAVFSYLKWIKHKS